MKATISGRHFLALAAARRFAAAHPWADARQEMHPAQMTSLPGGWKAAVSVNK